MSEKLISLGKTTTLLLMGLSERGKKTFTLADASEITGLKDYSLRNLIYRLHKKGLITPLKYGLYNIVPLEILGSATEHLGNPYIVAREIVHNRLGEKEAKYFLSHASAMNIHQMVTQPQLMITTTTTKEIKSQQILGTMFRFVTCRSEHYFGFQKYWIEKSEMILVSDPERTILDGLKMPEHCGGITEVAKGFWMKRDQINIAKLVDYTEKLHIGAVYRRLGYLLDIYKIPCSQELDRLQKKITPSYVLLDPTLPDEGPYLARWRIRANISEEEFGAVVRT